MRLIGLAVVLALSLILALLAAEAQQAGKVSRVGFLRVGPPPTEWIDALRQGLRELGYVEGQNLVIEYGVAQSVAQLSDVAAELVRLKVDVIVASGSPSVLAAKNATSTIPVVFVAAIDPVAAGVVLSLARPGGNFTGLTGVNTDLIGKRLELLKELLPKLSRIAILVRETSPVAAQYVKEAELAARALRASLQVLTVRQPRDLEEAFSAARGASAVLWGDDPVFTTHRTQIAELGLKHRLPTVSGIKVVAEAGALLSYGPEDLFPRAAIYVAKILRGAKPADLPVEQPTKFELVINLKTAKVLGLTIPPSVLGRADQVIE
jgi:putative tryptophan/tyrosine transport system substrate-binding protein